MQSEHDQLDRIDHESPTDAGLISIPVPDDFEKMDLPGRLSYVSYQLQQSESKYPVTKGELLRHISLFKIEKGSIIYSVKYIAQVVEK